MDKLSDADYCLHQVARRLRMKDGDLLDALEARLDVDHMIVCTRACRDGRGRHSTMPKALFQTSYEKQNKRYIHAYLFLFAILGNHTHITDPLIKNAQLLLTPSVLCKHGIPCFKGPSDDEHVCINPFHYNVTSVERLATLLARPLNITPIYGELDGKYLPSLQVCRLLREWLRKVQPTPAGVDLGRQFMHGAPPAAPL